MTKVPSLNYPQVVAAFERAGWRVVRQKGSHIRVERNLESGTLKVTACSDGRITLQVPRMSIRAALREIANQSGKTIAVDTNVRGVVSVNFVCVRPTAALAAVVAQVGATYCEERNGFDVSRRGQSNCSNPKPAVERVMNSGRPNS